MKLYLDSKAKNYRHLLPVAVETEVCKILSYFKYLSTLKNSAKDVYNKTSWIQWQFGAYFKVGTILVDLCQLKLIDDLFHSVFQS